MTPIVAPPTVSPAPLMSARTLRPLLGRDVVVRTGAALWRGTLVSCVRASAWFVVDDADVVVPLEDLVSVRAA